MYQYLFQPLNSVLLNFNPPEYILKLVNEILIQIEENATLKIIYCLKKN